MANTVTTLNYANTFGHWLAATDALIAENNTLAKDNYVKDSGTIYLSEGTLTALQSNGNVIVQKALLVQGVGSYATVQNDLTVERQGLFTNTEMSLVASGSANIANVLTVLGSGYGLKVQNDARVEGDLYVGGDLDLNILEARQKVNTSTLSVTGSTYTNKLQSNNQVVTEVLTANSNIYTSRLQSNTSITTTEIQANTVINAATISVTTGMYGNLLQANSSVNTSNASIVHTVYTKNLQANSSVNTSNVTVVNSILANNIYANTTINAPDLYLTSNAYVNDNLFVTNSMYAYDSYAANTTYTDLFFANTIYALFDVSVTGNVGATSFVASANGTIPSLYSSETYGDYLTANLHIYTPSIDVEGTTLTRFVQANSSMNTSNSSVVNTSWTKYLVANTLVTTAGLNSTGKTHTNTLQANTSANTETLSVTQRALIDRVQANTSVNTDILSVATIAYSNRFQANNSVNAEVISVTGNVYTNRVQANSSVNTATLMVTEKIDANDASVFVHDLETLGSLSVGTDFIINGTTIYNSDTFTLNASAAEGQFAYITVNRGQSGANAEIRWNESQEWWDIYETNSGSYFRILTNEHISDVLDSTNSLVVASSAAANALNDSIQTANTYLKGRVTSAESYANGAFVRANSSYTAQNTTAAFANAAYRHANAAFESANNVAPQVAPAYGHANAAFDKANTVVSTIRGTTGSVTASSAGVTLKSNNGIVIFATNDNGTGNTLSISTPQDLRTTGSPTFNSLSLTLPLAESQGGTGTTSYASLFGLAISAAAGSGADGKVLGTDGNGGYLWVTGGSGGGGGTQPGSRISSTRLSYTGDSQVAKFTTPTHSVGTQLRAYINGVRQLESEYWSFTANSIIWFKTPPVTGDSILIEVDGYTIYEYYANNIVYGPASGDMVGATIQDAIDNLETRKMPKSGGTFTGRVEGLTMPLTAASNTVFATGLYVTNHANSGYTLSHSIDGNAATVTNGVVTSGSYANPSWITSLAPSKLNAVIPDDKLATQTNVTAGHYGSASKVAKVYVDAKGRVTSVANVDISITKSMISDFPTLASSATTDTTSASNITSGTLPEARIPTTTVTTGSYGGAGKVATFTVDSKGRLTAAGETQISITKTQISDFPTIVDGSNAGNITSGTLAIERLPAGLAKTAGAAFTGDTSITGTGKITLASSGDITAYRTGDTTGVIFLNKAQTRYLYNNGSNYELPGQSLTINGSQALTLAVGGLVTGGQNFRSTGSVGTIGQSGTLAVYGDNGTINTNTATMSFHRPGSYAINMGLDVDNAFRIGGWSDNLGSVPYYRMTLDSVGNATFRNNVTAYSDVRLKTNIETVTNALDKVLKMRGVTYDRIDTGEKGVGVIAQEMKEVLPEVVMEASTDEEFMSVSYGNIVGVLIEAIKELKAEIEVLKGQNK